MSTCYYYCKKKLTHADNISFILLLFYHFLAVVSCTVLLLPSPPSGILPLPLYTFCRVVPYVTMMNEESFLKSSKNIEPYPVQKYT